uniref:Uncharacterized protein n=1 Tax=Nelumbo nucifera TaxID=4432 RepID=A0A822Y025_NELNU|nr:TPA_asm: hypothetical protein HUJ06_027285 [Nelumbo nucifera]
MLSPYVGRVGVQRREGHASMLSLRTNPREHAKNDSSQTLLAMLPFVVALTAIAALVHPTGDPENLQQIVDGSSEHKYSLMKIGKTLVTDEYLSYVVYVLQHGTMVDPKEESFVKANSEPVSSYYGNKPEMNELM